MLSTEPLISVALSTTCHIPPTKANRYVDLWALDWMTLTWLADQAVEEFN